MSDKDAVPSSKLWSTWFFFVVLGLFLTFRGYQSLEGDQAYRLPLLLHSQNPDAFRADPFVRAFEEFNPHRGSLAVMNLASRPLGLMAGLAALFLLTFGLTYFGIERLGRAVGRSRSTGHWAAALALLFTEAGNVGTNHLFEPILLDRLMALSLGWWAIALAIEIPDRFAWRSCPLIGLTALIHPSIGIQLALILGAAWVVWRFTGVGAELPARSLFWGVIALGAALLPGIAVNLGQPGRLLEGLPVEEFRRLSVELQSPQHMLPHLWRTPQWLAWFCFPALAGLALLTADRARLWDTSNSTRGRLVILILVNLALLLVAYLGVEVVGNLRLTIFQPFRMATVARGLCVILVAEHCRRLWSTGEVLSRTRVLWIAVALLNDWSLVVVTIAETGFAVSDVCTRPTLVRWTRRFGFFMMLGGLVFLGRHDTESGHVPLIAASAVGLLYGVVASRRTITITPGRQVRWLAACWLVPAAALGVNLVHANSGMVERSKLESWLIKRCRFAAVPNDEMERLAVWCRDHTPKDARFIGPPGPKSFRVWAKRSLAFNRASSPYHAKGLDDWSKRFMEHVGFAGSRTEFVDAYLRDRQALEKGYDALTPDQLSQLAARNNAEFIIARTSEIDRTDRKSRDTLELVHAEGRYAVYRSVATSDQVDAISAKDSDRVSRVRR